jgi:pre-mRNA 3'-end-processing factor FIP1
MMMEDDDDDFYDPADAVPVNQAQHAPQNQSNEKPQESNEGVEQDEEEIEVEEDEVCSQHAVRSLTSTNILQDDFNIITEAPPDAPPSEV